MSAVKKIRYEYIRTYEDLRRSYMRNLDDLGYPLRVEPKRDRYVVNKQALEKAIEKATVESIKQCEKEINQWINTEVREMIECNVQEVLDNVNVINNNFVVKHTAPKKQKMSRAERFAQELGKAIGKGISKILEETIMPDNRY